MEYPKMDETIAYIRALGKKSVFETYQEKQGQLLYQPRCGMGDYEKMLRSLQLIEKYGQPDILPITIDSYSRLGLYEKVIKLLNTGPDQLNGFPLVTYGWEKGRALNEALKTPLQVRHGSPDPTELFSATMASGITAFEGGGISYNIPYCKNFSLEQSLFLYNEMDTICGELVKHDIIVDREFFGTLTAVLMPPCISIAISIIEAFLAAQAGVKCLSLAYPQGGNIVQDVAALSVIKELALKYIDTKAHIFIVLHQFMGDFPKDRKKAGSLIRYGALTAKLGKADKIVTKTEDESYGIPNVRSNIEGIRKSKMAKPDGLRINWSEIEEEKQWIAMEVKELLDPVFESQHVIKKVVELFHSGRLDVPFSPSIYAKSEVLPMRDANGAIRIYESAGLPFSDRIKARNRKLLHQKDNSDVFDRIFRDIHYFSQEEDESC